MVTKRSGFPPIALALAFLFAAPALVFAQTTASPPAGQGQTKASPLPASGPERSSLGSRALAVVANVGYVPAKLGYVAIGGIVGAATLALTVGNTKAAKSVWQTAMGGDYLVTPDMIEGKRPVNFSGETDTTPDRHGKSSAPSRQPAGAPAAVLPGGIGAPPKPVAPGSSLPALVAPERVDEGAGKYKGPPRDKGE